MKNVKSVLSLFCSRLRPVEGLFLCIVIFFTSCENFMNGAELKKKIEEQVTLANAPEYQIVIDGNKGKFSPSKGSYPLKVTQSMELSFESDTDFAFIRWEVYNTLTGKTLESSEYIEIADSESDKTTIKLLKEPESGVALGVRSVVSERPQIISYTPTSIGMLKDSTIQVLFNFDMDPESIYFSDNEIDALKAEGVKEFLPDGNGRKSGYVKNGETFFKNILITNNKTGQNITDRFCAPTFESSRLLSIAASKDPKHVLDDYSQVLVRLEKGFFYKKQDVPVEMAGNKIWMYQVNSKTDVDPLVIKSFAAKPNDTVSLQTEESHTVGDDGTGLDTLKFVKDGNLQINVTVQEENGGSGPNSFFTVYVKKLYGENYATVEQPVEESFTVDFQNVTADEGVFDGTVDLKKEDISFGDGVYEMNFEFKDRSGNPKTYPSSGKFYFAVDTKAPEINMPTITSDNSTTYRLEWTDYVDLKMAEIIYGETGSAMPTSISIAKGTVSGDIEDITAGKAYDVKMKFTDYAGNCVEKNVPKFLTGISVNGTPDFSATNASHVENVFFETDNVINYNMNVLKYYSDGTTSSASSSELSGTVPSMSNYTATWQPEVVCTEGKISKNGKLTSGTYYVAKKGALTQTPAFYKSSSDTWYCKFGDYPQDVSTISSYTSSPVYNGWYLGKDGYFYEKCHTNISGLAKTRAGGTLTNDADRYFKVQPIEWRYANEDYNGKRLLIAKMNLDGVQYYTSTSNRLVNGVTIKPNNYEYSTLRAFLNGKYASGDTQSKIYQGNGFLQRAFTSSAQSLIYEGAVDNSAVTTNPKTEPKKWGDGKNENTCGTTYDKIFALSVQEATNPDFGFHKNYDFENWGRRLIHTTDYAKAKHVYESPSGDNSGTSNTYASKYWLRSPSRTSDEIGKVRAVDTDAHIHDKDLNGTDKGVVPALLLK